MNRERVLAVADRMEKAPDSQFDMGDWIRTPTQSIYALNNWQPVPTPDRHCGTAGCIAGWVIFTFPEEAEAIAVRERGTVHVSDVAQEILGMFSNEARSLFNGYWHPGPNGEVIAEADEDEDDDGLGWTIRDITKAEAIAELRRLAAVAG